MSDQSPETCPPTSDEPSAADPPPPGTRHPVTRRVTRDIRLASAPVANEPSNPD